MFSWTRTFYSKKHGVYYCFDKKANRDFSVTKYGHTLVSAKEAYQHYSDLVKVPWYLFEEKIVEGLNMAKQEYGSCERFVSAQAYNFRDVEKELKRGKKLTCWMWYIFPQIKGLGYSETAKYYEIQSLAEAREYLSINLLRSRLQKCCQLVLDINTNNPVKIFGQIDAKKLQASMTLFSFVDPDNPLYREVLDKYFEGVCDIESQMILDKMKSEE